MVFRLSCYVKIENSLRILLNLFSSNLIEMQIMLHTDILELQIFSV
ncbi:hypothetical protein T4E_2716 [Trichinella pseudospiralis]|uniref:Uncharacterized protein n=1 Tax=Trichinella pseudospiralis TaxID=6337 RepID=A0A0V0XDM1_TRIPS|nr:hypothetical protein T4E_2716 [Trichinella pseudospiralis]